MSTMPIRCFTCGKVVNSHWSEYMRISEQRQVESQGANDGKSEALDKLKIFRYCCRRMFLGHEEKDIAIDYAVASQSY